MSNTGCRSQQPRGIAYHCACRNAASPLEPKRPSEFFAQAKYRFKVVSLVLPMHVRASRRTRGKVSKFLRASWSEPIVPNCSTNLRATRSETDGMHISCRTNTVSASRSRFDVGLMPDGVPEWQVVAHFLTSCLITIAVSSTQAVRITCEPDLNSALMHAPNKFSCGRLVVDRSPSISKNTHP